MSTLIIPIAPLSRSKSRLSDCFTRAQLKEFTIAMFKDLIKTISNINCFREKIVYCNSPEILDIAEKNGLIGIKEEVNTSEKSFNDIINDFNKIAINEYDAKQTILCFLDLILISEKNFYEINALLEENQIVVCPAIRSAGISVLGRNPADIISYNFSDSSHPSLFKLYKDARNENIEKIAIYDSIRASFDVDIKEDLFFAYDYLKVFNLTHTETYKFLKNNLKLSLEKISANNNREFKITNNKKGLK